MKHPDDEEFPYSTSIVERILSSFCIRINLFVNEYKYFMGISQFPEFDLQTKFASLVIADSKGFDFAVVTAYQPLTGQHSLCVSMNLELSKCLMNKIISAFEGMQN